jgi:hypothetical protein
MSKNLQPMCHVLASRDPAGAPFISRIYRVFLGNDPIGRDRLYMLPAYIVFSALVEVMRNQSSVASETHLSVEENVWTLKDWHKAKGQ